jgi:hypothetical protein
MDTRKEKSRLYYKTINLMMDRYSKDSVLKAADIIGSKNLLDEVNVLVEENLPEVDFLKKLNNLKQKAN